ncbi:MAG: bifunctional molybdenum cofactor biosynthesis protein MoaC/MoaB [Flavobacteriales bacterium]|nr:MAG: bifunctional molybdenum cofactor biosynthesis protein MoaC/MoaB [Flavobacteriales bacterium]
MIDITHKTSTLRQATAQAVVKVSKQETAHAIVNKTVPKGDVFEMAKTAGLLAVKRTAEIIPDCHPIPIEHTAISFEIDQLEIRIKVEVKTIYKTGVEVEAMHGASVVALTVYDMLKPIDKGIEIASIKLLEKKGGKTDFKETLSKKLKAAVIVSSDSVSKGKKEDTAGKIVMEKLKNFNIEIDDYTVLPDEPEELREKVKNYCNNGLNLVVITGGTGLSPRDNTPEAIKPLIEREIPGIMEAARNYGLQRTPYAMLSRGIAGMHKNTLILAVPGSSKGAAETIDALFPHIIHIFKVQEYGFKH